MKTDSVRLQAMNIENLSRRSFLKTSAGVTSLGAAACRPAFVPRARRSAAARRRTRRSRRLARPPWRILKPSKKDLEHGFELHANSLVFESYGFAPRAAPDGDMIRRAMASRRLRMDCAPRGCLIRLDLLPLSGAN